MRLSSVGGKKGEEALPQGSAVSWWPCVVHAWVPPPLWQSSQHSTGILVLQGAGR